MNWHVVSVNSPREIEITQRINSAGFAAVCPTWIKKFGHHRGGRHFFQTRVEVLFPRYLFVAENIDFRKEEFESSKAHLTVFRKRLLTDEAIQMVQSTAMQLTLAQSNMTHSLVIKRGDVMQILHGAMQGDHVEILQARKEALLVRFKMRPEWKDAWVSRAALGKAV